MSRLKSSYKRISSAFKGVDFSLHRMICKGFALPEQTPHYQFLDEYELKKELFRPEDTAYFRAIVYGSEDLSKQFYHLPAGLTVSPEWWVMPWGWQVRASKPRKPKDRIAQAYYHVNKLISLYESIKTKGYSAWKGGAISGYILNHPEKGTIFNYIDGHHRIATLSFLADHRIRSIEQVKILPLATVERNDLINCPACQAGILEGCFTAKDALLLFDHVFQRFDSRSCKKESLAELCD
jgi:hypothetical protein